MNTILARLRRLFFGESEDEQSKLFLRNNETIDAAATESEINLNDSSLTRLMFLVEQTREGEYACEETLDLLDEYAELTASGQNTEAIMPLVKAHLEHCVDCRERYEALMQILEG